MTHDWLLVETLGSEPAVVAQGRQTKNLVPISTLLRRNPNLMAIQTAIGETVRAGVGLSSITPKNDRVIRTEVVQMSDGLTHGVHVWVGPPDMEPPERPVPADFQPKRRSSCLVVLAAGIGLSLAVLLSILLMGFIWPLVVGFAAAERHRADGAIPSHQRGPFVVVEATIAGPAAWLDARSQRLCQLLMGRGAIRRRCALRKGCSKEECASERSRQR